MYVGGLVWRQEIADVRRSLDGNIQRRMEFGMPSESPCEGVFTVQPGSVSSAAPQGRLPVVGGSRTGGDSADAHFDYISPKRLSKPATPFVESKVLVAKATDLAKPLLLSPLLSRSALRRDLRPESHGESQGNNFRRFPLQPTARQDTLTLLGRTEEAHLNKKCSSVGHRYVAAPQLLLDRGIAASGRCGSGQTGG
jgi:hypothetical protein